MEQEFTKNDLRDEFIKSNGEIMSQISQIKENENLKKLPTKERDLVSAKAGKSKQMQDIKGFRRTSTLLQVIDAEGKLNRKITKKHRSDKKKMKKEV